MRSVACPSPINLENALLKHYYYTSIDEVRIKLMQFKNFLIKVIINIQNHSLECTHL